MPIRTIYSFVNNKLKKATNTKLCLYILPYATLFPSYAHLQLKRPVKIRRVLKLDYLHPSVPVHNTAADRQRPFRHLNGHCSCGLLGRYSRLQIRSGSSLPSLQSTIELQKACSGTHVPSLHLKPFPGHSKTEIIISKSYVIDIQSLIQRVKNYRLNELRETFFIAWATIRFIRSINTVLHTK